MSETFRWTSSFETGLPEVDRQHHKLVNLINAVGSHLATGHSPDAAAMERLFDDLEEYAVYHFREEESLMERAGLADGHVSRHRAAHEYFAKEVTRMRRASAPDDLEAGETALKFLTHWLAYHILGMDQTMARQLERVARGVDPAQALTEVDEEREGATGPLVAALDGLFEQVAARNRQLEEFNRTLEARVAARTEELARANRKLEEMAMTDVLTGLPNRRHALGLLERAWQDATTHGATLSVIMIDADGFKPINDTFGHDAGDDVLRELARVLGHGVRTDDAVCRMGGDEFMIVCRDTPRAGAERVANDTWRRVSRMRVALSGGEWRGSISVGVAGYTQGMDSPKDLIKAADQAVYAAKAAGRNCVRIAG